jgi:hypothetical protein
VSQLTKAEDVVRRVVNPFSTAITRVVQTTGRRSRRRAAGRASAYRLPPFDEDGGAGVREPRRPLPSPPSDHMALELPRD